MGELLGALDLGQREGWVRGSRVGPNLALQKISHLGGIRGNLE